MTSRYVYNYGGIRTPSFRPK
ncbi:unnamed protein product, partial [Didymodactylos carnosus]